MMTGEFTFAAVSSVALIVLVPMQFTAGSANSLSFASLYNASSSSPNNTPGLYFFMFVKLYFKDVNIQLFEIINGRQSLSNYEKSPKLLNFLLSGSGFMDFRISMIWCGPCLQLKTNSIRN